MEIEEATVRLREELVELSAKQAELTAQIEAVKARREAVTGQLRTLREVAHRYSQNGATDHADAGHEIVPLASEEEIWCFMYNRQDAILEMLRLTSRSAHINEIVELLRERGRDDTYHSVSAGLSALKRKGRVVQASRGVWRLSDQVASASGTD